VVLDGGIMTPELFNAIIGEFAGAIRQDLEEAAGIALAAEACASTGNLGKAAEIANGIDELTHDVGRLLSAAALIARRHRHRSPGLDAHDE